MARGGCQTKVATLCAGRSYWKCVLPWATDRRWALVLLLVTTSTTVPLSALRNATLSMPLPVALEPTRTAPGNTKRLKWPNA